MRSIPSNSSRSSSGSTAPFLLVSRLRASMRERSRPEPGALCRQRQCDGRAVRAALQGSGHPTRTAKAALNMLTRAPARGCSRPTRSSTAVDTGWITDERPHHEKLRIADGGWRAPSTSSTARRVSTTRSSGSRRGSVRGLPQGLSPAPLVTRSALTLARRTSPEPHRDCDGQGRRGSPATAPRPPRRTLIHPASSRPEGWARRFTDPARRSGRMSRRTPFRCGSSAPDAYPGHRCPARESPPVWPLPTTRDGATHCGRQDSPEADGQDPRPVLPASSSWFAHQSAVMVVCDRGDRQSTTHRGALAHRHRPGPRQLLAVQRCPTDRGYRRPAEEVRGGHGPRVKAEAVQEGPLRGSRHAAAGKSGRRLRRDHPAQEGRPKKEEAVAEARPSQH